MKADQHLGSAIRVSAAGARRFLLLRSGLVRRAGSTGRWLDPSCTSDAVQALEYVQVDPMRVLERSHHLVLGARVTGYRPADLDALLYASRDLVEVVGRNRLIVPTKDLWMFWPRFAELEGTNRPHLSELEPLMAKVLARIAAEGPLSSSDFTDTETISGFWDPDGQNRTRAVRQAMEWLWHFGRIAVSHRKGLQRYFDLPERLFGTPPSLGQADLDAAADALVRKYCRAAGLVDCRDWSFGWGKLPAARRRGVMRTLVQAGEMIEVRIDDVANPYYVASAEAPALLAACEFELAPDVRFLPPLDNVLWWRERLLDVFNFAYTWEAYTPAAKRRYGPYTCPILVGDRLVGRVDARLDRGSHSLVVNGLWWEDDRQTRGANWDDEAICAGLTAWAATLGASEVVR